MISRNESKNPFRPKIRTNTKIKEKTRSKDDLYKVKKEEWFHELKNGNVAKLKELLKYDKKLSELLNQNPKSMKLWNDSVEKAKLSISTQRTENNIGNEQNIKFDILTIDVFER